MYEIALTVAACRRADTRVDVAWLVDAEGFGERDPSEAVALTPGGGRVGALLAGGLDDQLADVAGRLGDCGRFVTLEMADWLPSEVRAHAAPAWMMGEPPWIDCIRLDSMKTDEILAAFERAGYTCRQDQDLIDAAIGAA